MNPGKSAPAAGVLGAIAAKDGETVELGQYLQDLGGMDVSTILQMVKDGAAGKLVDVSVGDKVKVEVIVD